MEEQNDAVGGFEVFDSAEAMMESNDPQAEQQVEQQADQVDQSQSEQPQVESAPSAEPQAQPSEQGTMSSQNEQTLGDEDLDAMTLKYLSEKLGTQFESFDQITAQQQTSALDERVEAISRFVQETGRSPQDWFAYQSLNPQEMDDTTAVRVKLATEHPNLSSGEVDLLMKSKYNVDDALASEEEVNVAKLQLKIDAEGARQAIDGIRQQYLAPTSNEDPVLESFIDDQWIDTMSKEVDALQGLEFDVADGKTFTFSLDDNYRGQLKDKQANLDSFFDRFVQDDGNWDFDGLSSMFAVRDNIDKIVSSAYRQGMSDGQRNVVSQAANISTESPQATGTEQNNPLSDQVRQLMRGSNGLTFKI